MSLAITITTSGDALAVIQAAEQTLQPAALRETIGLAGADVVQRHLFRLGSERPNKLGGRSTGYYAAAGRSVNWRPDGDAVVVSINHIGIAQRYFGGTITPKESKSITIPAVPEAHGKRAREFPDLEFAVLGKSPALIRRKQTLVKFRRDKRTGLRRAFAGKERGGEVIFWLRRSVTQKADPSVLPTDQQLLDTVLTRVAATADTALQRAGGPTP